MPRDNVISRQKIDEAAGGDPHAIRETLYQIAKNLELQGRVANTDTKNPPGECVASVSAQGSTYIVQIQLPGTSTPGSVQQGIQQQIGKTAVQNNVAITSMYHQIQAANTPHFNAGSSLHQYGGQTGSTQTYWTISDLGSGAWYFRTRSSYDGKNWNLWKQANGGKALNARAGAVATVNITNGTSATLLLPGSESVAFIAGTAPSGGTFSLPADLYTSAMHFICCPNGFVDTGHPAHGIQECDITIPSQSTVGLVGPANLPPLVTCVYQDGSGHTWPSPASFFGFCFDPLGANVGSVTAGGVKWSTFVLPGGGSIAVGHGKAVHGATIAFPAGFSAANMLGIASPQSGYDPSNEAHGVYSCNVDGGVVSMQFADGSGHIWSGSAQWLIVAYSAGIPLTSGFLAVNSPGGSPIAIGAGSGVDGTQVALPAGFTKSKALFFAAPRTFTDTGHPMHCIAECSASNGILNLSYQDGSGNQWTGNVGWICFAWQ